MKIVQDTYYDRIVKGKVIVPFREDNWVRTIMWAVRERIMGVARNDELTEEEKIKDIKNILNEKFNEANVHFTHSKRLEEYESEYGINKGEYAHGRMMGRGFIESLWVSLNSSVVDRIKSEEGYAKFVNGIENTISHEWIHKEQVRKEREVRPIEEMYPFDAPERQESTLEQRLEKESEIMAYADSAVNSLLKSGRDAGSILKFLRNPGVEEKPRKDEEKMF